MANVLVQESSIQAIADAIRYKTGGTDTYKPREMAPAIRNLPGTGVLQNLSVTENGNYAPAAGVDGFDSVSVAVPSSALTSADEGKVVQNGALMPQTSLTVSANGTYDTTTKDEVVVNVPQSGGAQGTYYESQDGTIGVYVNGDVERRWYFNGVVIPSTAGIEVSDPQLAQYVPSGEGGRLCLRTKAYDSDKTTQIGVLGFYYGKIVAFSNDLHQWNYGTFWGTMDTPNYGVEIGGSEGSIQLRPYEAPPTP